MTTISAVCRCPFVFDKMLIVFWCGLRFILFEKMDQRNCNKFCVKNEIKCAGTYEMLTMVFGESTKSRTQVQMWYNRFQEDREEVNDDACPGRPSTLTTDENFEAVKKMILDKNRITIRERLLMMLRHIFRLMPSNFYGCFRHETCSSEDCSKIAKF